jgi:hypothetical protein
MHIFILEQSILANTPLKLTLQDSIKTHKPEDKGQFLIDSRILDYDMSIRLEEQLPSELLSEGFNLAYATYADDIDLDTLYHKTKLYSPCLILIKTVEQSAVIGAFISGDISPPISNKVRGDAKSFVFRLDNNTMGGIAKVTCAFHKHDSTKCSSANYCYSSHDYLMCGGDNYYDSMSNALSLSSTLATGTCGWSDTFCCNPLIDNLHNNTFRVAELEVYCGANSMQDLAIKLTHHSSFTPMDAEGNFLTIDNSGNYIIPATIDITEISRRDSDSTV